MEGLSLVFLGEAQIFQAPIGQQIASFVVRDLSGLAADDPAMRHLLTLRCGIALPLLDRMDSGKYLM